MTRWAPETAEPFLTLGEESSSTALGSGRTGQGDSPLSPTAECPGGSGGKGCSGKQPRGPRRGRGSRRVTVGRLRGHKSSADLGWEPPGTSRCGPALAALQVLRPGCSTACARRRRSSWLSGAYTSAQPRKEDGGAGPCTPPARARGEAPPRLSLAPGDWRLDDEGSRARDVIGCNPQSLNEPGRGGATSGRDTTARLFQGRQAPFLAYFVLFTRVSSLMLTKLRVHDYKFSATNRSHTFGGRRLKISVGHGYGSFRYH